MSVNRASTVSARQQRRRVFIAAAVLVMSAVVVAVVGIPDLSAIRQWADAAGPWFPVLFVGIYVVFTQLPIPRTVFTVSTGLLFGPVVGSVVALVSTAIAAAVSLTVVRTLGRDWVRRRVDGPIFAEVDRRLARRGWLAVGSLRMVAGVPFSILNYACAMTAIPLGPFLLGTVVGSAPGTIALVVLGDALTGSVDPRLMMIAGGLVVLGLVGLFVESRLPAPKSQAGGLSDVEGGAD
ncbi:TVP38/TMEM64 family protein [Corynebacterium sp. TAE3-ERU12]|uniref:TVP38/TMEM64 family protein n=1 Tax=Corynebacterium sp. TAE3-ERU12 TaxID=2849491 RepID=UPI001C44D09E|nr:TVP38/TMEM64 family protein [Corynebacterium sp. TAE3-ERU12]MBV7295450.1 TVP38/TMEM64 family protein [Corynebacterium sp. TAE3-ERU12]